MEQINATVQKIINEMQENAKRYPIKNEEKKIKRQEQVINVPCKHCDGTGYYFIRDRYGMPDIKPCEYCAAERKMFAMLMKSGVNPKDYARYTLDKFDPNVSNIAKLLKNKAIQYLHDHPKTLGFGAFGNSGNGKTHICIAVCQELTKHYHEEHYYFSYTQEMPLLVKARKSFSGGGEYNSLMQKWKKCPNLYIDDLFKNAEAFAGNGVLRLKQDEKDIIHDIVSARYTGQLKTFFSSEYSIDQIINIDQALGSRIYDMIYPYGIFVNGKNVRLMMPRGSNKKVF